MKKTIEYTIVLTVLIFVCYVVVIRRHSSRRPYVHKPNPIRPVDFPEILVAPESAVSLDHSSPSNSRRAASTYSLSFTIHDPYPSENTRNFINEHLISKGWFCLKYHLLNPDTPLSVGPFGSDWPRPKGKEGEWPISWMEDWLSKNNESISIFYRYVPLKHEPELSEPDLNRLSVHLSYIGQDSQAKRGPWISQYKKLHPEEFGGSIDANKPHSE